MGETPDGEGDSMAMRIGRHLFPEPSLWLAPMEEITTRSFRRLCRRFGADAVVTEFTSAEGLIRHAPKSLQRLQLDPEEHPVGVQIYGAREEALVAAAQMAEEAGADWVDINFGCPAREIAGKGAGAALLKDPPLMARWTRAVVRAVSIPVTVKTRLGWDEGSICIVEVARRLEDAGIQALAIHARTRAQGFSGSARWEWIARVRESVRIPVIGNGDVRSPEDAARMWRETRCHGIMIGRGAMGNPWIFRRCRRYLETGVDPGAPSPEERLEVLREHLWAEIREKGERRAVIEFRKYLSGYLRGLPHASRWRTGMMTETTAEGLLGRIAAYVAWLQARTPGTTPAGIAG
jgi:tRNA-dihydrouridine synthase B